MAMAALRMAKRLDLPTVTTNHSLIGNILFRAGLLKGCAILLRASDAVIAVSRAVGAESKSITGRSVHVIPNGVDSCSPNGVDGRYPFEKAGRFVVATVSRMTKKKGVEDLVELAPGLVKKFDRLLFLMVGGGPLEGALQTRVQALGIADHFVFTGEVSRATVLKLLTQADAFVLPCKREAFGIVVLEAISKDLPVVAINHSGVSDIITHNLNGLLADDDRDLPLQLERLIVSETLADSLAGAARDQLEKYQWPNIAAQVEDVYAQVIDENRHAID